MKFPVLIALICAVPLLAGCGGDESPDTTQGSTTTEARPSAATTQDSNVQPGGNSPSVTGIPKQPKVRVPQGPAPTGLVVREIKKGSGTALTQNDKFAFRYVGVDYNSGKTFEARWDRPFVIQAFGNGELLVGQERAMRGMKVGGRREMIVPDRLGYENGAGPLIYVVELVSVEK